MKIEIEREEDGRWIAEIPELPGVMVYGDTRNQAIAKAKSIRELWRGKNEHCKRIF